MSVMYESVPKAFVNILNHYAEDIHSTAVDKGWWDNERNDGEILALIHSEISEALEGLRHGNQASDKIPAFSCAEEEMADVLIRILDWGYARNFRIAEAFLAKLEYNLTRSRMHGGKKF